MTIYRLVLGAAHSYAGTPIDRSVNAVLKRENDVYGAIDGH
ncbi:hypothetical protein AB0N33_19235 [Pseudarthrobacter oxydans]|jgi:hypothetical protein|uniref:Uncharacterized protein n=1 Tax=Pseudarthrobacter oxydans TaxID=1671 RepID=A0AAW8NDP2_PSEOX|nr:hypothetical protein [Pseudarthrobacter oxydans]MDR6793305.1 hypothetical protein [Pseudarthrobacter oxydans]MDR7164440.1 hypothetical protein [Pseudarthrobacter oxydans]